MWMLHLLFGSDVVAGWDVKLPSSEIIKGLSLACMGTA